MRIGTRRLTTIVLAVGLSAGVGLTLTSCFPSAEQIVEGAIEQAGGGNVDIGGAGALPDGFPADVPVIDGEILNGFAAAGAFNVNIRAADTPDGAFAAAESLLTSSGFTRQVSSGTGGAYQSDAYSVLLAATAEGDKAIVNYVVTPVAR